MSYSIYDIQVRVLQQGQLQAIENVLDISGFATGMFLCL
jgi:hypothetical protein